jgi:hypothetical protein
MEKETKRRNKAYTLRKVEDNLKGVENNITEGTDVSSEPFPFSKEDYKSNEQYHYGAVQDNSAL